MGVPSLTQAIRDYLQAAAGTADPDWTVNQMTSAVQGSHPVLAGQVRRTLDQLAARGQITKNSTTPVTYTHNPKAKKGTRTVATTSGTQDQRTVLRGLLQTRLDEVTNTREKKTAAETAVKAKRAVTRPPVKRPNGQSYVPRELAGKADVDRLAELRDAGIYALLAGPPGTGKTALVEAAFGRNLFVVTADENTGVDDFLGQWSPTGKADEFVWVDGPLVLAMRAGGVLFVDDATLASPKVLAVMYPAMDGRGEITVKSHVVNGKPDVVKAAKGFYVVAAHNPGVTGAILTDALASRFIAQIWVETDLELAASLGVGENMLKLSRALLLERNKNDNGLWVPQLREMLAFRDIARKWGELAAAANLLGIAPEGPDRDAMASKMSVIFGKSIVRLEIGGQI